MMAIQLPPQVEELIEAQVASGRYADAGEVIAAGVRLLDEQDRQVAHLRSLLIVAEEETARGEVDEWTPALRQRIRHEAEEMARQGMTPDPDVCP